MDNQQGLFVQKIRNLDNDRDIDLSYLSSFSLVETLDLTGPLLMVTFRDQDAILRDDLGLRQGATLEVVYSDFWNRPDVSADQVDRYVVITAPEGATRNELVNLNCLQEDVWKTKRPATATRIFAKQAPVSIAKALFPGLPERSYRFEKFAVGPDYHLLAGERPAKTLRQMASEAGGKLFYQRRELHMRRLGSILEEDPAYTYTYNGHGEGFPIIYYNRPNTDILVEDVLEKHYCGWDMVKGKVWATRSANSAPYLTANGSVPVLNNLSMVDYPEVDFVVNGSGALRPGIRLDLKWLLRRLDSPMNENLPEKIIVGTVAHFYSAQKYLCRIKGVMPLKG